MTHNNWIVCLTKNNLQLTIKAIETFRRQDIGNMKILVIDNGSTDNTPRWLCMQDDLFTILNTPGKSIAASWNEALKWLFNGRWSDGNTPMYHMTEYALVVNNDVELRPDTYRRLVEDGGGFVTAVGDQDPKSILPIRLGTEEPILVPPDERHKRPHPDFSCFLIRADVYEAVGPFDENFRGAYCEDGDYDMRMWKKGIRAYCLDLPYLHHGAMTVKNADIDERLMIQKQADMNREYFKSKWGFAMGSEEYYQALGKGRPEESDSIVIQSS